eukprot:5434334-Amphidinium_carterae.1
MSEALQTIPDNMRVSQLDGNMGTAAQPLYVHFPDMPERVAAQVGGQKTKSNKSNSTMSNESTTNHNIS